MKKSRTHTLPTHYMRAAPKRRKAAKARPEVTYAPGHFTDLIVRHDWPPRFVSRMPVTATVRVNNRGNGFDRNPLGLAGAAEYTARWEGK